MDRSALKLTLSNGLRDYRIDYIIAHCYQLFKLYQDSTDQVRVRQPVAEVWRVVGRGRGTPGQHHDAAPLKLGDCVANTGHWSQETLGNVVCSFSCGQWTCGTAAVSHGLTSVLCGPPGLYRGPHQPAASCLQQHQGGGEPDRGVSHH